MYMPHASHLVVLLRVILLVDTDSVDLEEAGLVGLSQAEQRCVEIALDTLLPCFYILRIIWSGRNYSINTVLTHPSLGKRGKELDGTGN